MSPLGEVEGLTFILLDLAHPWAKVAIEADGRSHLYRAERDALIEESLASLGVVSIEVLEPEDPDFDRLSRIDDQGRRRVPVYDLTVSVCCVISLQPSAGEPSHLLQ